MYFLKDKGCYYFPEIAPLYRTMRASDVDIDRFSFAFAGAKFDVVFAINRKPFELMFGCVGHGKCNFILTMEKGYMLSPISDEVFETLCRVLHLSYRGDRFTSYKFLQHVASKVPQKYSGHKIQPHEVAQVRNDIPDKEKFYFVRWYPHIRDMKTPGGRSAFWGNPRCRISRSATINWLWILCKTKADLSKTSYCC